MVAAESPYSEKFILRLKKGEEKAFNDLFKANFSKLYHFANTIIGNPSRAKDIVQELFVSLWTKPMLLDEKQSLENYLYVSIRNSCYTYLRRQQHHIPLDESMDNAIPSDTAIHIEDAQTLVLWNAVESLPLQQKIIFKLLVVEECSYKETASRLGISVNTVKTQMQRACKHLKQTLPPLQFFLLFTAYRFLSRIKK